MSTDTASADLNAAPLPIPTAQRLDIFVMSGCLPDAMTEWHHQTGLSNFHSVATEAIPEHPFVEFCGVCLFSGEYLTPFQWAQIEPFFTRAKAEANVFQYSPVRKNFTRRDAAWFEGRIAFEGRITPTLAANPIH